MPLCDREGYTAISQSWKHLTLIMIVCKMSYQCKLIVQLNKLTQLHYWSALDSDNFRSIVKVFLHYIYHLESLYIQSG